jgi:acetylornithine/N-succinyldiaminopimelate aminotransferase
MNERQLFQQHLAPTSTEPLALPIVKASGSSLWDASNNQYIDLIGGISVCNVGHCHPAVVNAIKKQAEQYLHIMVYGEVIQSPQVQYATLLADNLPESLNCVYFTNSGAEAVEGAMKLAKRVTGRSQIIACNKSYHGSTQGALSILGDEYWRSAYRPLLPMITHIDYNKEESLNYITADTACIILEAVQAEAGVHAARPEWLAAVRQRCTETGTLLILDEIQTGFGRTGTLWAFEQYGIIPDVLLLGKALGGGMPLGAFISSAENMKKLAVNPVLGHITTFGGHPVSCAAGKAALEALLSENMVATVAQKQDLFISELQHPLIQHIRAKGLLIAVEFSSPELVQKLIQICLNSTGKRVFSDWFLFAPQALRIAPPLTISNQEIKEACSILKNALHQIASEA